MHFVLLTHQRELKKHTNTGSMLVDILGKKAEIITWERKNPSTTLLNYIAQGSTALLYPSDDSRLFAKSDTHNRYIIIDGTWQEANKIYNRSPYLHRLPKLKLHVEESLYKLRRNQKPGGLCTAECAIAVLEARGFDKKAIRLKDELDRFQD